MKINQIYALLFIFLIIASPMQASTDDTKTKKVEEEVNWAQITTEDLKTLSPSQLGQISPTDMQKIVDPGAIEFIATNGDASTIAKLSDNQIQKITTPAAIEAVVTKASEETVNKLTQSQVQAITTPAAIDAFIAKAAPANIKLLSPGQVQGLDKDIQTKLTAAQRAALTATQLTLEVLQNLEYTMYQLNSDELRSALNNLLSPKSLPVVFTIDANVRYENGRLFNKAFECKVEPSKCGLDLAAFADPDKYLSLTAVTDETLFPDLEFEQGFVFCTKDPAVCTTLLGRGADQISHDGENFVITYTDANGIEQNIKSQTGDLQYIVTPDGIIVIGKDKAQVIQYGAVFELQGKDGTKLTFSQDQAGNKRIKSEGAVKIIGPDYKVDVQTGTFNLQLYPDNKILSGWTEPDARAKLTVYTTRQGKKFESVVDGNFMVTVENSAFDDITLNDPSSTLSLFDGLIKIPPGKMLKDYPFSIKLQTDQGRELLSGDAATLSDLLKLRKGYAEEIRAIKEGLEKGDLVTVTAFYMDEKGKTVSKEVRCKSYEECKQKLVEINPKFKDYANIDEYIKNEYDPDRLTSLLENSPGKKLYLSVIFDSEKGDFTMGDMGVRGKIVVESREHGTFSSLDATTALFFRTKPGAETFYYDSPKKTGRLAIVDWKAPATMPHPETKEVMKIVIYNNKAYLVGSDGRVYDERGTPQGPSITKEVTENGKDPSRRLIMSKKDGLAKQVIDKNSILEKSLLNSKTYGTKLGIKYIGHDLKVFGACEKSTKEVCGTLEINSDTKQITLGVAAGVPEVSFLANDQIDGTLLQQTLENLRGEREEIERIFTVLQNRWLTEKDEKVRKQIKKVLEDLGVEITKEGIIIIGEEALSEKIAGLIRSPELLKLKRKSEVVEKIFAKFAEKDVRKTIIGFDLFLDAAEASRLGDFSTAQIKIKEYIGKSKDYVNGLSELVKEIYSDKSKTSDEQIKAVQEELDVISKSDDFKAAAKENPIAFARLQLLLATSYTKGKDKNYAEQRKILTATLGRKDLPQKMLDQLQQALVQSHADELMAQGIKTESQMKSRIAELVKADPRLKGLEDPKVQNNIYIAMLQTQLKTEKDAAKVDSIITDLLKRIKDKPNSQQLFAIASAKDRIGQIEEALRLYRQAEETKGDEAAAQNYDVSKGFEFFGFKDFIEQTTQARLFNYQRQGLIEDMKPTGELFLASKIDRSYGNHESNPVRSALAQAYLSSSLKQPDKEERETQKNRAKALNEEVTAAYESTKKDWDELDDEKKNQLRSVMTTLMEQASSAYEFIAQIAQLDAVEAGTSEGYKQKYAEAAEETKKAEQAVGALIDELNIALDLEKDKEKRAEIEVKLGRLKTKRLALEDKIGELSVKGDEIDLRAIFAHRFEQVQKEKDQKGAANKLYGTVIEKALEILKKDPDNEQALNILAKIFEQQDSPLQEEKNRQFLMDLANKKLQDPTLSEDQRQHYLDVLNEQNQKLTTIALAQNDFDKAKDLAQTPEQRTAFELMEAYRNGDTVTAIQLIAELGDKVPEGLDPRVAAEIERTRRNLNRFSQLEGETTKDFGEGWGALFESSRVKAAFDLSQNAIQNKQKTAEELQNLRNTIGKEKPTKEQNVELLRLQNRVDYYDAEFQGAVFHLDNYQGKEGAAAIYKDAQQNLQKAEKEFDFLNSLTPEGILRDGSDYVADEWGTVNGFAANANMLKILGSDNPLIRQLAVDSILAKEGDILARVNAVDQSTIENTAQLVNLLHNQLLGDLAAAHASGDEAEIERLTTLENNFAGEVINGVGNMIDRFREANEKSKEWTGMWDVKNNAKDNNEIFKQIQSLKTALRFSDALAPSSTKTELTGWLVEEAKDVDKYMSRIETFRKEEISLYEMPQRFLARYVDPRGITTETWLSAYTPFFYHAEKPVLISAKEMIQLKQRDLAVDQKLKADFSRLVLETLIADPNTEKEDLRDGYELVRMNLGNIQSTIERGEKAYKTSNLLTKTFQAAGLGGTDLEVENQIAGFLESDAGKLMEILPPDLREEHIAFLAARDSSRRGTIESYALTGIAGSGIGSGMLSTLGIQSAGDIAEQEMYREKLEGNELWAKAYANHRNQEKTSAEQQLEYIHTIRKNEGPEKAKQVAEERGINEQELRTLVLDTARFNLENKHVNALLEGFEDSRTNTLADRTSRVLSSMMKYDLTFEKAGRAWDKGNPVDALWLSAKALTEPSLGFAKNAFTEYVSGTANDILADATAGFYRHSTSTKKVEEMEREANRHQTRLNFLNMVASDVAKGEDLSSIKRSWADDTFGSFNTRDEQNMYIDIFGSSMSQAEKKARMDWVKAAETAEGLEAKSKETYEYHTWWNPMNVISNGATFFKHRIDRAREFYLDAPSQRDQYRSRILDAQKATLTLDKAVNAFASGEIESMSDLEKQNPSLYRSLERIREQGFGEGTLNLELNEKGISDVEGILLGMRRVNLQVEASINALMSGDQQEANAYASATGSSSFAETIDYTSMLQEEGEEFAASGEFIMNLYALGLGMKALQAGKAWMGTKFLGKAVAPAATGARASEAAAAAGRLTKATNYVGNSFKSVGHLLHPSNLYMGPLFELPHGLQERGWISQTTADVLSIVALAAPALIQRGRGVKDLNREVARTERTRMKDKGMNEWKTKVEREFTPAEKNAARVLDKSMRRARTIEEVNKAIQDFTKQTGRIPDFTFKGQTRTTFDIREAQIDANGNALVNTQRLGRDMADLQSKVAKRELDVKRKLRDNPPESDVVKQAQKKHIDAIKRYNEEAITKLKTQQTKDLAEGIDADARRTFRKREIKRLEYENAEHQARLESFDFEGISRPTLDAMNQRRQAFDKANADAAQIGKRQFNQRIAEGKADFQAAQETARTLDTARQRMRELGETEGTIRDQAAKDTNAGLENTPAQRANADINRRYNEMTRRSNDLAIRQQQYNSMAPKQRAAEGGRLLEADINRLRTEMNAERNAIADRIISEAQRNLEATMRERGPDGRTALERSGKSLTKTDADVMRRWAELEAQRADLQIQSLRIEGVPEGILEANPRYQNQVTRLRDANKIADAIKKRAELPPEKAKQVAEVVKIAENYVEAVDLLKTKLHEGRRTRQLTQPLEIKVPLRVIPEAARVVAEPIISRKVRSDKIKSLQEQISKLNTEIERAVKPLETAHEFNRKEIPDIVRGTSTKPDILLKSLSLQFKSQRTIEKGKIKSKDYETAKEIDRKMQEVESLNKEITRLNVDQMRENFGFKRISDVKQVTAKSRPATKVLELNARRIEPATRALRTAAREAGISAEAMKAKMTKTTAELERAAELRPAEKARKAAELELTNDPIWKNLQEMKKDARLKPKEIEGEPLIDKLIELEAKLLESRTPEQTATTLKELGKAFKKAGETVKAYDVDVVKLTVGDATSQLNLLGVQARLHRKIQEIAKAEAKVNEIKSKYEAPPEAPPKLPEAPPKVAPKIAEAVRKLTEEVRLRDVEKNQRIKELEKELKEAEETSPDLEMRGVNVRKALMGEARAKLVNEYKNVVKEAQQRVRDAEARKASEAELDTLNKELNTLQREQQANTLAQLLNAQRGVGLELDINRAARKALKQDGIEVTMEQSLTRDHILRIKNKNLLEGIETKPAEQLRKALQKIPPEFELPPLRLGDGILTRLTPELSLEAIVQRSMEIREGTSREPPKIDRAELDARGTRDQNIKQYTDSIARYYEKQLGLPEGSLTIKAPETPPRSGNEVFLATYTSAAGKQTAMLVKVFTRTAKGEVPGAEAFREVEALRFLKEKGVEVPDVVDIKAVEFFAGKDAVMVTSEIAPGRDINYFIKKISEAKGPAREKLLSDLETKMSSVGKELANFNQAVKSSEFGADLSADIAKITAHLKKVLDQGKLDQATHDRIKSELEKKIEILEIEGGATAGLVHGDFHAGNVFIKGNKVTFIDVESALESLTKGRAESNLHAGNDYARLVDTLYHDNARLLKTPEIDRLTESFMKSYKETLPPELRAEFDRSIDLYKAKTALAMLKNAKPGSANEANAFKRLTEYLKIEPPKIEEGYSAKEWELGKRPEGYERTSFMKSEAGKSTRELIGNEAAVRWVELVEAVQGNVFKGIKPRDLTPPEVRDMIDLSKRINNEANKVILENKNSLKKAEIRQRDALKIEDPTAVERLNQLEIEIERLDRDIRNNNFKEVIIKIDSLNIPENVKRVTIRTEPCSTCINQRRFREKLKKAIEKEVGAEVSEQLVDQVMDAIGEKTGATYVHNVEFGLAREIIRDLKATDRLLTDGEKNIILVTEAGNAARVPSRINQRTIDVPDIKIIGDKIYLDGVELSQIDTLTINRFKAEAKVRKALDTITDPLLKGKANAWFENNFPSPLTELVGVSQEAIDKLERLGIRSKTQLQRNTADLKQNEIRLVLAMVALTPFADALRIAQQIDDERAAIEPISPKSQRFVSFLPGGYYLFAGSEIPIGVIIKTRGTALAEYCKNSPNPAECEEAVKYIQQNFAEAEQKALDMIKGLSMQIPSPEGYESDFKEMFQGDIISGIIDPRQVNDQVIADAETGALNLENLRNYFPDKASDTPVFTCGVGTKGICKASCTTDEYINYDGFCSPIQVCCKTK